MYAFMERHRENAILVFRFENPQKAVSILQEANIKVFAAEELASM
jgi:hypothetical protein